MVLARVTMVSPNAKTALAWARASWRLHQMGQTLPKLQRTGDKWRVAAAGLSDEAQLVLEAISVL